jgi:hypothetical protein
MLPNPALAAASSCAATMAAAQQRGLDVASEWRALDTVHLLAERLQQLTDEPPPDATIMAAALAPWLDDQSWVDRFVADHCRALADDPLTAMQFRLIQGRVAHGLLMLHCGAAEVTLNWIDAAALPTAVDQHVLLMSALSVVVVVRANGLVARRYALDTEDGVDRLMAQPPAALHDGQVIAIDCRRESLNLLTAAGDAVLLRFNLLLPFTAAQRTFACDTGLPMGAAMGDDGASRMLPLLAIPRMAGAGSRAAGVLADLSADSDPVLRWAAMREYLVADTPAALDALRHMADRDDDAGVRRVAAQTLEMLIVKRSEPCPA